MKYLYKFSILIFALLFSCGKVPVNIDDDTYNAKIVVDGYLFASEKPENIRITRNYALNQNIDFSHFLLADANVSILHVDSDQHYQLDFNPLTMAFEYSGDDFLIQAGQTYTLHVTAQVEDEILHTSSTTTVPETGFKIDETALQAADISYDKAVSTNNTIRIAFKRSPNCGSYIGAITALDASLDSFIEENVLGLDIDMLDDTTNAEELEFFNYSKYQSQWQQTETAASADINYFEISWFSLWFYGRYQVILYAADQNFTDYYLTHSNVMEMDGNLIEPRFHFEGDGIGVFGSAICDTTFFTLLP